MAKHIRNRGRILQFSVAVPERVTEEDMKQILADLMARSESGVATVKVTPVKPTLATWRTRKERAAGKGFACTVKGTDPKTGKLLNCGRKDLRTPLNTGSHTLPNGHSPR